MKRVEFFQKDEMDEMAERLSEEVSRYGEHFTRSWLRPCFHMKYEPSVGHWFFVCQHPAVNAGQWRFCPACGIKFLKVSERLMEEENK